MFPPHVPRVFIEWLTEPGDTVYDPFCGRGTAPLEACRLGRIGIGSDANPLAVLLAGAKIDPPTTEQALSRIQTLRDCCRPLSAQLAPPDIRMLYNPKVLGQLLWLRDVLSHDARTDRFLLATLLGLLHANYTPGRKPRGLSISMPNTFSMAPNYVRGYIRKHSLRAPRVDVFDMLEERVQRLDLPEAPSVRGRAFLHRVEDGPLRAVNTNKAKLIFTSPPYLEVIKYGKFNWVRLWMLKYEPKEVDEGLIATSSLDRYLAFMVDALDGFSDTLSSDGHLCIMVGDVRNRATGAVVNLAESIWTEVAEPGGWSLAGRVTDNLPVNQKVSRIWKGSEGRATKTDRILILRKVPTKTKKSFPGLGRIRWDSVPFWA